MRIQMAGVNSSRAPIEVRERFSFLKSEIVNSLKNLKKENGVEGALILSTCNRTELWLSTTHDYKESVAKVLCSLHGLSLEEYQKYLIVREEDEAIKHLFYTTAGLNSQIIGEDQILTQVREALDLSRLNYCSDSVLEVLFRMAVTSWKKCKTQVNLPVTDM